MFARSLAFDGDLDFKNDYALCGDPFHVGIDRGTGHPDNIFYPGPALFWLPVLELSKLFSSNYASSCGPPWSTACLALSPLAGALTALFSYLVARRFFSDGVAGVATGLIVIAGPTFLFSTMLASYSHVYDALCVALLVWLSLRALDQPERRARWLLCGLVLGACTLQRISNEMFLLVPGVCAFLAWRHRPLLLLESWALVAVASLAGLLPMLGLYKYLYGHYFTFTHGRYFLQIWQPHPWLLLFNPRGGLFLRSPILWLSVAGAYSLAKRRALWHVTLPLLALLLVELWLSSAAVAWESSRRLLNATPLFVLCAAAAIEKLSGWLATPERLRRALALSVGAFFALPVLGMAFGSPRGEVPKSANQEKTYGTSVASFWHMIDLSVGDLAIWPAEIVFHARYGLPMSAFQFASNPRYQRNVWTLAWQDRTFNFADVEQRRTLTGFRDGRDGAVLSAPRGTFVFAAMWPFATHLVVHAHSARPTPLRIGTRELAHGVRWFESSGPVQGDALASYEYRIPPGTWHTGLVELVFEADSVSELTIDSLQIDDRAPHLPAFD
jgi:hypothetical protein